MAYESGKTGARVNELLNKVAFFVTPEEHGAAGDGTTNDSAAFDAAITAAGVGGVLMGKPGSVYVIDTELNPLAGQSWIGNGATIKRINQATATTSSAITAGPGPTTITVDDASGFRVGCYVTVTQSGTTDPSVHLVTAISGNDVTVGADFSESFSSGATLLHAANIIRNTADDVVIEGWEFDGNRANYQPQGLRWENHTEIRSSGDRCRIVGNYIHDAPVEGVLLGGADCVLRDNTILDSGGNAIHFSGLTGAVCSGNSLKNTQLWATEDPGHQDGVISLSNSISGLRFTDNYLSSGNSGLGSIDSAGNSDNLFANNTVESCTAPWDMSTFSDGFDNIQIIGNRFSSCGEGVIQATGGDVSVAGEVPARLLINDNVFDDTWLLIGSCRDIQICNNSIHLSSANASEIAIYVTGSENILISGNRVSGGNYGAYIYNTTNNGVWLVGNNFYSQVTMGVRFQLSSGASALFCSGNSVVSDSATASGSYIGILVTGDVSVMGNFVTALSGSDGIQVNGSDNTVSGNRVAVGASMDSIDVKAGSTGDAVVGNFVSKAVTDGTSGGSTVADNYVVAA